MSEDLEKIDELVGGLKNALDRNQGLESAKKSFLNAGYEAEKISIAVAHLKEAGVVEESRLAQVAKDLDLKKNRPGFFKRLFGKKNIQVGPVSQVSSSSKAPVQIPPKPIPQRINISDARLERMLASRGQNNRSRAIAAPIYTIKKRPSELHEQLPKKPGFFKRLFSKKKIVIDSKKTDKIKTAPLAKIKNTKPLPKTLRSTSPGKNKPLPKLFFIIMIIVSLLILVGAAILGLYWDNIFR
jgi:hypothetical protein